MKANYESISIFLSSFINTDKIKDFISITPTVANLSPWMDQTGTTLFIWGTFDPNTNYTLTLPPDLTDLWGSRLGKAFTLHFRTGNLDPQVQFPYGINSAFLTDKDIGILANVTNVDTLPLYVGTLTMNDLLEMLSINGYDYRQNFTPHDVEAWNFYPAAPTNQATQVTLPISPDGKPRTPGLYFMRINIPGTYAYASTTILAVSHIQATVKVSPSDAFVWAVDLDTNTPAADLPVSIYTDAGQVLASGTTDASGVFAASIEGLQNSFDASFAMLGTPGEDDFGFAFASWNEGLSPWDFDLTASYSPLKSTPIYTPIGPSTARAIRSTSAW